MTTNGDVSQGAARDESTSDQTGNDRARATVVVAREAGACYGVERALRMVGEAANQAGEVHTLGPLIHNPRVVRDLASVGVSEVDSLDGLRPGSTVVVRTHGVVPSIVDEARALGLGVLDATCPHVKKVHDSVSLLRSQGYQIVIVGDPGHPEVEAIVGYAGDDAIVVNDPDQLADVRIRPRVGVVAQTTQTHALLQAVVSRLTERAAEVRVFTTICSATRRRQQAAAELAGHADVIVVVGGRNSGNTSRLAQICRARCARTHHIEGEDELESAWFEGARVIGITAGASTPSSQIMSMRDAIVAMTGAKVEDDRE
ncbi:MAG: 4-hydroxy-3-methylbut-2-enyl diphosphate reductase [Coriobacteriales bacterium]|jgi:4-hydroxy-3-methylbut-2-enyl diphosphate reductase